ncbi:MAG: multidrug effflux MFS transporter [Alphaproteobacteria bacterium]|nr:multidrug effflux MFS transporter [Alphaproteobacteria bacterium]
MSMNKMIMAGGLAVALLTGASHAQMIGGEVTVNGSSDDVAFLGGELTVRGDIQGSVSGIAGEANIDANISGDIEFFGGEANVSGRVDGEVDMAGGAITIRADIGEDANVAAGDVELFGTIGGELNTAGGSVELDVVVREDAHIGGGAVLISQASEFYGRIEIVGGEIDFLGTAHGPLDAEAETITLAGTFNGDVEITAERVRILASAVIPGEIIVRGPREPEVDAGASLGTLSYSYEAYNFGAEDWEDLDIHIEGPWKFIGAPFEFFGGMFVGSAFLLGLFIILIAPSSVGNIASAFRERPVSSGFLGFVTFALSPIVIAVLVMLLAVTVIGIPLIPLMIFLYPVMLFLSFIFGGVAVGDIIFNRSRPNEGLGLAMRALSLLVVMIALVVLGAVPGLGWIAGLIVMSIGLGAWMLSFGRKRNEDRSQSDDEAERPSKRDPEPSTDKDDASPTGEPVTE